MELAKTGNYLTFELKIGSLDGRLISEDYHSPDTDESRQLWEQLKKVIKEAATYDDFETKVHLMNWECGSIIIAVNMIKNIQAIWTDVEVRSLVKRAEMGIRELKLNPLELLSIVPGKLIKCDLEISSALEDTIDGFLESFEQRLLSLTVNGDPSKYIIKE